MPGVSREVSDEPGVDGAQTEVVLRRQLPGARHVLQNPLELGPRKVGVQHQAGFLPYCIGQALRFQLLTARCRAAALPDNGVTERLAGRALPGNSSLPLIGDPKRYNLYGRNTGLFKQRLDRITLSIPNSVGVVFHPACLRVYLR